MRYLFPLCVSILLGIHPAEGDDPFASPDLGKDSKTTPFKHKLAADIGKCPDGHKALKDIPILYGHVGPLYKRPEEYTDEDRKLRESSDRGEIVFGLDILYEHSPVSRVVCKQCGFSYHPSDTPVEFPHRASWERTSNKAGDFRIKFSKELLEFPLMEAKDGTISYSQSLSHDGTQLQVENISFRTSTPMEKVLKTVREWLKNGGKNPDDLEQVKDILGHAYQHGAGGIRISIRDDTYWHPGEISVSLTLLEQEAILRAIEADHQPPPDP